MIPSSSEILTKFTDSIEDCRALYSHCLSKIDKHTDAGIEASFLQLVKSWESFLEDSTLILLCGQTPLSGNAIEPKFILQNKEDVREIIYNGHHFTDWINTDNLINRFTLFFKTDSHKENRLIKAIKHNQTTLREIKLIRNEIAHSSFSTGIQINKMYKDFAPFKRFIRPAEYLKEFSKIINTQSNFIYYAEAILVTSQQIIG